MLFLSPQRREEVKTALSAGHTDFVPMIKALADPAFCKSPLDALLHEICLGWLEDNQKVVTEQCRQLIEHINGENLLDLNRANQTLGVVLAYDFAKDMIPDKLRGEMAELLLGLARSFLSIRNGNPHIVTNNWYMLTHGACCLAAMAVDGEKNSAGDVIDSVELEHWALNRCKAFCQHFGNAGLYHEGSGYICYTLSMLAPLIVAQKNKRGFDLTLEHQGLRHTLHSMFISIATVQERDGPGVAMLDWNDTGRSVGGLNPFVPLLTLSDKALQGGLLQRLRTTIGSEGANKWECSYKGLPMALAIWPLGVLAEDPEKSLARSCMDNRHGLGHWRSSWQDETAVLIGWYARTTHASPGHSHDDAGSIRLLGLGQTWICGGGQARSNSIWQSVLTHANKEDRPAKHPNAYVFSKRIEKNSACIGIEMRHALGAYSERYVSWNVQQGYPMVMAIMDLLTDHREEPKSYTWNLSMPSDLNVTVDEDGKGFTATNAIGRSLRGQFLLDTPDTLELCTMPESKRTFSGGKTVHYPGDYYVSAGFAGRSEIKILVLLTLVEIESDRGNPVLDGQNILLANGRQWVQPFAGAILSEVDFTTMKANLQLYPTGKNLLS